MPLKKKKKKKKKTTSSIMCIAQTHSSPDAGFRV
jgi:hypothetical protein